MDIFTDIVTHDSLGEISVCWNSAGKVTSVQLLRGSRSNSFADPFAIASSLKAALPTVYSYLVNYGDVVGKPIDFATLDMTRHSEFSINVYKTLSSTNWGQTVTYGELATTAGYPRAARAVGSAMCKNRLLMLVPCHRVVGHNSIGNFSNGIDTKIKLMLLEGMNVKGVYNEG